MILDSLRNFFASKLKKPMIEPYGKSAHNSVQILFTADQELKAKVLRQAKKQGITLKSLFVFCMQAYLDGRINVSVIGTHKLPLSRGVKIFKTEEQQVQEDAARLVKRLRYSLRQPRDIL